MTTKTITLRLSQDFLERARTLAQRRGQSLNRLFQDSLNLLDEQEREQQLFNDFSTIADAAETDVEYAMEAQIEAIENR